MTPQREGVAGGRPVHYECPPQRRAALRRAGDALLAFRAAALTKIAYSDRVSHGMRVRAAAEYALDESDPDLRRHVFVYRIRISNEGDEAAQLESRHWIIVDGNGRRQDVRGRGVVGEFPRIEPGASYEYTSRCPIATDWGTMEGSYLFRRPDGRAFDVEVGRFYLAPTAPPIAQQMRG